jgi:hypothetical protein
MKYEAKLYFSLKAFQQYVARHLMQGNQGDFLFLVVGSKIANLTLGHNSCFKDPNRSREPILDIYVPRDFQ